MSQSRREARERALGLLYEAELKSIPVDVLLDDLPVAPDEFVIGLVRGVDSGRGELAGLVQKHLRSDWTVDRLPMIDRIVLAIATFELSVSPDTPVAVIISEAVELAKRFSGDQSGGFVNGVLSSVARAVRP